MLNCSSSPCSSAPSPSVIQLWSACSRVTLLDVFQGQLHASEKKPIVTTIIIIIIDEVVNITSYCAIGGELQTTSSQHHPGWLKSDIAKTAM